MKLFQQNSLEGNRSLYFLISLTAVLFLVTQILEYRTALPLGEDPPTHPVDIPADEEEIIITVRDKPKKATPPENTSLSDELPPDILDDWPKLALNNATTWALTDGPDDEPENIEAPPEPGVPMAMPFLEKLAVPMDCRHLSDWARQEACLNEWISRYIKDQVRYPEIARNLRVEEKIYVQFVIDREGVVRDAQVIRGENEALSAEALRVIESLPTFRPASQNGMKAAMRMVSTVNFKLQ